MTIAKQISVLIALASLVSGAIEIPQARAQAPGPPSPAVEAGRFGDWVMRCRSENSGRKNCVLVQEASSKNSETEKIRRIMTTVVGKFGKDRRLGVLFTLPLGVRLPIGIVLKVDNNEDTSRLPYQFCSRRGCRVAFLFDDKWLKRFKAGDRALVTVTTRAGQEVTVPVSLKGFTIGVKAVETS